ncbi:hypothetical protein BJX62DRAFT_194523 [Aspergillus germanicus]
MSQGQWQCGLCSTQFSRAEHLRRHLRSHENKRPYECSLCQRSFTRRYVSIPVERPRLTQIEMRKRDMRRHAKQRCRVLYVPYCLRHLSLGRRISPMALKKTF